jgi:stage V sporulation protein G
MKIVRMNPLEGKEGGKMAAFFDIQTPDEIIIKGFRLVNGAKGMFISPPDQKGKDGKYYESVVLPKEIKASLEKLAIQEFDKMHKN